jgi:acyl-CoA hydrolase
VVTLSVDQVLFRQPIHVGELVTFLASGNHTGRSSMEVGIKVLAEDIPTRRQRHVNSCYFTMVAIEEGRPVAIPALQPASEAQARRQREAELRKSARLDLNQRFQATRPTPNNQLQETT